MSAEAWGATGETCSGAQMALRGCMGGGGARGDEFLWGLGPPSRFTGGNTLTLQAGHSDVPNARGRGLDGLGGIWGAVGRGSVDVSDRSIFGKCEVLAHCRADTQGFQPRPQRLLTLVLPSADALQRVTHSCALKMSIDPQRRRPGPPPSALHAGLFWRWPPPRWGAHLPLKDAQLGLLLWKPQLGVREVGGRGGGVKK